MPVKEKLQTRLAVGRSGVLRVETPEEGIVEVLQRGVKASYDAELRRFILRPDLTRAPKGRKCRFHRYPNGVHHLSVPISPSELELIEPFRIVPVRNWSIEDDGDEEMVVLTMPDNLKLPKGYVGYTRTPDLPRDAKPPEPRRCGRARGFGQACTGAVRPDASQPAHHPDQGLRLVPRHHPLPRCRW